MTCSKQCENGQFRSEVPTWGSGRPMGLKCDQKAREDTK